MARTFPPLARILPAFAIALPLAGCISFGPKTPATLMTLHAAAPVAAGATRTGDDAHAVAVGVPTVNPSLATQRVMVQAGPTSIAYLKDASWAAAPAVLFRNLLAETITARTGRIVPDPRLVTSQPDTRLTGQLAAFGLDGPGMAVVVTYDGTIMRAGSPQMRARRFTARLPVSSEDPAVVGAALDQAANQVAADVADWVGAR